VRRHTAGLPPRQQRSVRYKVSTVRLILTNTRLGAMLLLSGVFLMLMMGLTIWGKYGLLEVWSRQRDLVELAQDIDTIERQNAILSQEIQRLRDDMGYIEKIAREELGLVRPGELVIEFVE
jgi:cell division protein FtsB